MTPATRRRGGDLEAAIFDAVFAQLETVGYRRLTMEGVAAAARTGKAALYRRWRSKDDLITDALKHVLPEPPTAPATGRVREDMLQILRTLRDTLIACRGAAFRVLKEESDDGKGLVHEVVRERLSTPVRDLLFQALEDAAARGEIRPAAATRQVANVGPAVIVYHSLTEGGAITDDYLVSVVDEILIPMLRP
ncbi:TetR/AcrR family transcriptional regulator C-terminal ligand-binding domain-containing protein [Actinomadura madurae]|uniref:TetR-like C-terminal domain-containing protein n=1 Tax=Actinomadura madurae TaxID=1993 RepID=UPI0020267F1A|nr:TetR-like C-terminal domain-containing protein [Actinomadura madurae]URN05060.1 TetR/AcrR family transcriptional regulator C-terminal ligand-binding domain-containing protein [Actinomadura madurae]